MHPVTLATRTDIQSIHDNQRLISFDDLIIDMLSIL